MSTTFAYSLRIEWSREVYVSKFNFETYQAVTSGDRIPIFIDGMRLELTVENIEFPVMITHWGTLCKNPVLSCEVWSTGGYDISNSPYFTVEGQHLSDSEELKC